MRCSYFILAFFAFYVIYTGFIFWEMAYAEPCKGKNCYWPMLKETDRIDLSVRVDGMEVWNATNLSASEQLDVKLELPVPPEVRRGTKDSLLVDVLLSANGRPLARARAAAVKRMLPRGTSGETMLLPDSMLPLDDELLPDGDEVLLVLGGERTQHALDLVLGSAGDEACVGHAVACGVAPRVDHRGRTHLDAPHVTHLRGTRAWARA